MSWIEFFFASDLLSLPNSNLNIVTWRSDCATSCKVLLSIELQTCKMNSLAYVFFALASKCIPVYVYMCIQYTYTVWGNTSTSGAFSSSQGEWRLYMFCWIHHQISIKQTLWKFTLHTQMMLAANYRSIMSYVCTSAKLYQKIYEFNVKCHLFFSIIFEKQVQLPWAPNTISMENKPVKTETGAGGLQNGCKKHCTVMGAYTWFKYSTCIMSDYVSDSNRSGVLPPCIRNSQ